MSFLKSTKIYFIANILNASVPFILLPILTRYLTPNEYGKIAIFQATIIGISAFIGLNTIGAASRKFYDDNLTNDELTEYNNSCFQILLISLILVYISLIYFEEYISSLLSIPSQWLYLSIFISTFTFILNFQLAQWQIRNSTQQYIKLVTLGCIINLLLSIIFVLFLEEGAKGRVHALFYTSTFSAIVAFFILYKNKFITFKKININQIKEALDFGVPLIPHILGSFLISCFDRFVINGKLGLSEAGIYMVAVQISMGLTLIFDAINKSYVPWLFDKLKKNDVQQNKIIIKNTYYYFIFLLILALLIFLYSPFFATKLVGSEYKEIGTLIGWLCLGQIFGGMYLIVTNYIFYSKETWKLSFITIFCGLLNIFLMIILINFWGIEGVAFAFFISKLMQFIVTWWLASKAVSMPWLNIK